MSDRNRLRSRTQLIDIGNTAAIVAKSALFMVTRTIGVNAAAGRPSLPSIATFSDTAVVPHRMWQWFRYQGFFVR